MDELDELESLDKVDDSGDIKNKILFSVLVVSTIIFICIYSCDSFKKVVIIYLKWVKRPIRTPEESAWGNFFRKKATFLWGRAIGRANFYWLAKGHLRKSRYGDHVTSTAAVVDAESWGEYVTVTHWGLSSKEQQAFPCGFGARSACFAGPKPKIPFLVVPGLSLLRNRHEKACYACYNPPNFNFKQEEPKQWVRRFSLTCFRC